MAEPRRVPLLPAKSTFSNEKSSASKCKENDSGQGKKEEKSKNHKSVRLELNLAPSNEKNCPEYSYVQLVKDVLVCCFPFYKIRFLLFD